MSKDQRNLRANRVQSAEESAKWIELFEWLQEQDLDVGEVRQAVRNYQHSDERLAKPDHEPEPTASVDGAL